MQVIFLPRGSGPRRNLQLRLTLVCAVAAGVLLAVAFGGGYLGYHIENRDAGSQHASRVHRPPQPPADQAVARRRAADPEPAGQHRGDESVAAHGVAAGQPPRPAARGRQRVVNHRIAEKFAAAGPEKLSALQAELREQRLMLHESRRRLEDQIDSLGQRLGRIQAHVSRLNALGLRLTDMAGLDPDEFSFDNPPALGGPERPGPWEGIQQPEFVETLQMIEIALQEKETELQVLKALLTNRELHQKQYPRGWPAAGGGWMSSGYGSRTDPFTGHKAFHEGVDIAVRRGSEVRTMAAGVVSYAGRKTGYGLVAEINHGNGYQTRYAHAKKLLVKAGERVHKGDAVALVGSTGRSTGSHVHIEVLKNGETVNPAKYLKSAG